MIVQFAAVGIGAAIGAWLRWGLSAWLNPRMPAFPLGTLSSNLLGGLVAGVALAFVLARPGLAPEWKLFAITGVLGGLTTFSTFSIEVAELLLRGNYAAGTLLAVTHLAGSVILTIAGFAAWRSLA